MNCKLWLLLAAHCLCTTPALAADLPGPFADNQRGGFAGLRVRASLGAREPDVRAALTLTPTTHNRRGASSRMAMGEGLELGIAPGDKLRLTLAGQPVDQLGLSRRQDDRSNLSTLATVAIVLGVVVIAGGLALDHIADEASCFHGSSEC